LIDDLAFIAFPVEAGETSILEGTVEVILLEGQERGAGVRERGLGRRVRRGPPSERLRSVQGLIEFRRLIQREESRRVHRICRFGYKRRSFVCVVGEARGEQPVVLRAEV
jgi:hypothetical protein